MGLPQHSPEARAERDRIAALYKSENLPLPCWCGASIGLYGTLACTPGGCLDGSKSEPIKEAPLG